jgi:hypothetical protein
MPQFAMGTLNLGAPIRQPFRECRATKLALTQDREAWRASIGANSAGRRGIHSVFDVRQRQLSRAALQVLW